MYKLRDTLLQHPLFVLLTWSVALITGTFYLTYQVFVVPKNDTIEQQSREIEDLRASQSTETEAGFGPIWIDKGRTHIDESRQITITLNNIVGERASFEIGPGAADPIRIDSISVGDRIAIPFDGDTYIFSFLGISEGEDGDKRAAVALARQG